MASSSPTEIASVSCPGEPNATDRNVTETTPLVKKSKVKRSGLLRRFRESLLIKSKAASMILFWGTLAYIVYESLLNLRIAICYQLFLKFEFSVSHGNISRAYSALTFINMLGSGVYGLIGIWLLFYPLAGYLADVRYGRYKVVTFSLKTIWLGIVTVVIMFITLYAVAYVLNGNAWLIELSYKWDPENTALFGCGLSLIGLILVAFIILSVGFAAFAANAIQFGID